MQKEMKLLTPLDAARHLKVSKQTLVNWDNEGLIPCFKTPGGHRRFRLEDILARVSNSNLIEAGQQSNNTSVDSRQSFCYARVSTSGQKEDLERQIQLFKRDFSDFTVIKDIGSGLNFKRKGLQKLLGLALQGKIKQVVVTYKDRLCRFGFELFETILKQCSNGTILVLNTNETSPREELCNDLLSIITVFSSRLHGLRSHSLRKQLKQSTSSTQDENQENQEKQN